MEKQFKKEAIVSYETAKIAKELGFVDLVGTFRGKHYYNHRGILDGDVMDFIKNRKSPDVDFYKNIAAPTQSLLQKWLREELFVFIDIGTDMTTRPKFCISSIKRFVESEEGYCCEVYNIPPVKWGFYRVYEEVLEAALMEAMLWMKDGLNKNAVFDKA